MGTVLVAAGGGGDAVAAALVAAVRGYQAPVIATYAWDRLSIDPTPGPRGPDGFCGLERIGALAQVVTAESRAAPPAGSTLPRLAGDLPGVPIVVVDASGGATGIRGQLAELVRACAADRVEIVDVGGDVLATGTEPGLASPLGDALMLAAAAGLDVAVDVTVIGPGADGELTEAETVGLLPDADLNEVVTVEAIDMIETVFSWHPSEASAVVVAAARGARGIAEIRDRGRPVQLTARTAGIFRVSHRHAIASNHLAAELVGTDSLTGAEEMARALYGVDEIDYERAKTARTGGGQRPSPEEPAGEDVAAVLAAAAGRATQFVTTRRVAESVGVTVDAARAALTRRGGGPRDPAWPLWTTS